MRATLQAKFDAAYSAKLRISVRAIQRAVAAHYGLRLDELLDPDDRSNRITRPRQVGMFLAAKLTPKSYLEIATFFRKKAHHTIIHGVSAIDERLDTDADLLHDVDRIAWRVISDA